MQFHCNATHGVMSIIGLMTSCPNHSLVQLYITDPPAGPRGDNASCLRQILGPGL